MLTLFFACRWEVWLGAAACLSACAQPPRWKAHVCSAAACMQHERQWGGVRCVRGVIDDEHALLPCRACEAPATPQPSPRGGEGFALCRLDDGTMVTSQIGSRRGVAARARRAPACAASRSLPTVLPLHRRVPSPPLPRWTLSLSRLTVGSCTTATLQLDDAGGNAICCVPSAMRRAAWGCCLPAWLCTNTTAVTVTVTHTTRTHAHAGGLLAARAAVRCRQLAFAASTPTIMRVRHPALAIRTPRHSHALP